MTDYGQLLFGFQLNPAHGERHEYGLISPSLKAPFAYFIILNDELYKIGGWNQSLSSLASRYKNGSGSDARLTHTPEIWKCMNNGGTVRFMVDMCKSKPVEYVTELGVSFQSKPDGKEIERIYLKEYFEKYQCYPRGNMQEQRRKHC